MTADVAVVIIFAPRALRPLNITYYNIQITTSFLAVCWSLRDSFFPLLMEMLEKLKILLQNRSFLLGYTILRLSLEVYLHPIWVYFGKKEAPITLARIGDLLG